MDFDLSFISSSIDSFFSEEVPQKRIASSRRIRISNMRDLVGFSRIASDKLIHISQQDFWHIGQDEEGHFIERLVSDADGPIEE